MSLYYSKTHPLCIKTEVVFEVNFLHLYIGSGFELLGGESDDQSSRAGYSPSSPRSHRDEVTDGKVLVQSLIKPTSSPKRMRMYVPKLFLFAKMVVSSEQYKYSNKYVALPFLAAWSGLV